MMDWFQTYPADYRHDTWHLTLAEHGAYKLLIDHYMLHEKPLPDNDNALASIVGTDLNSWLEVSSKVREFFTSRKGMLIHKRCEVELNKSFEKRKDGKKRVAKYRKSKGIVTRDKRVSNAPRGEERRGEEYKDIWNEAFASTKVPKIRELTQSRENKLLLRFSSVDEFKDCISIVKKSPHLMGENDRGWKISLDWLLEPKNFNKVMEGNYIRDEKGGMGEWKTVR